METLGLYYAIYKCDDKSKIIDFIDEPLTSYFNKRLNSEEIVALLQNEDLLTLALTHYKLVDTLWKAIVKHKWLDGLNIIVEARLYNNKEMLLFCLEEKWKDGILRLLKECDDDDFYSLVNTKNLETHCFTPKIVGYKPAKCGAKLDEPVKKYIIPRGRHPAFRLRRDNTEPVKDISIECSSELPSKKELNKLNKEAEELFMKCINKTEEEEILTEPLKAISKCAKCFIEGRDANHVECPYKRIKICYPHFETKDYKVNEFTEVAVCSPEHCSKCQESENGEFDMISNDGSVKDI